LVVAMVSLLMARFIPTLQAWVTSLLDIKRFNKIKQAVTTQRLVRVVVRNLEIARMGTHYLARIPTRLLLCLALTTSPLGMALYSQRQGAQGAINLISVILFSVHSQPPQLLFGIRRRVNSQLAPRLRMQNFQFKPIMVTQRRRCLRSAPQPQARLRLSSAFPISARLRSRTFQVQFFTLTQTARSSAHR